MCNLRQEIRQDERDCGQSKVELGNTLDDAHDTVRITALAGSSGRCAKFFARLWESNPSCALYRLAGRPDNPETSL